MSVLEHGTYAYEDQIFQSRRVVYENLDNLFYPVRRKGQFALVQMTRHILDNNSSQVMNYSKAQDWTNPSYLLPSSHPSSKAEDLVSCWEHYCSVLGSWQLMWVYCCSEYSVVSSHCCSVCHSVAFKE